MDNEKWKQPSFSYLTDVYFDYNAIAALPFLLKKNIIANSVSNFCVNGTAG